MDDSLRAALAALEPFERNVVELVYFEHLTQRQVAELLELAPVTVAKTMAHSLSEIARVLESDRLADAS